MKMKMRKFTTFALAAALAIGTFGTSVPAKAADNSTDYTITIPATLSVANAGWNATDGITAQVKSGDTFDSGKKLTVTATSTNGWALKSGQNTIGYNLATATGTYSSSATPASWEFSADELNAASGTNKAMGIIVDDYSTKPAGTYQDTVTFTAKVEDAVVETLLTTITATGQEQASYSEANVATVSFSYSAGGSSAYTANWGWWGYGWTATVTPADGYTITKCVFYDDANRTATDSEAPFVVETTEEDKTPKVNSNPILAYTSKGIKKIEVYGYAN